MRDGYRREPAVCVVRLQERPGDGAAWRMRHSLAVRCVALAGKISGVLASPKARVTVFGYLAKIMLGVTTGRP